MLDPGSADAGRPLARMIEERAAIQREAAFLRLEIRRSRRREAWLLMCLIRTQHRETFLRARRQASQRRRGTI